MKPASSPVCMPEGYLASMSNDPGLTSDDGSKAALKAGLELTGHQGVVCPCLVKDMEV